MNLLNVGVMLAMGQQAAPGTQPDARAQALQMVLTIGLMAVMFYLVLIRPQSKKDKARTEMLKTVRPGDKIVTSGGVIGVVVTVKDKTLSIRSADSKFEITKAAVTEITERSAASSEA